MLVGLLPLLGGVIMYGIGIYAIKYYGQKANAEGKEYSGLTLPIWFGAIGMVLGFVLMLDLATATSVRSSRARPKPRRPACSTPPSSTPRRT